MFNTTRNVTRRTTRRTTEREKRALLTFPVDANRVHSFADPVFRFRRGPRVFKHRLPARATSVFRFVRHPSGSLASRTAAERPRPSRPESPPRGNDRVPSAARGQGVGRGGGHGSAGRCYITLSLPLLRPLTITTPKHHAAPADDNVARRRPRRHGQRCETLNLNLSSFHGQLSTARRQRPAACASFCSPRRTYAVAVKAREERTFSNVAGGGVVVR